MSATVMSNARRATIAALVLAAVAIVIQIASGAAYPAVPPGLVILGVAALLTGFVRTWWTAVLAAVLAAFLNVGLFVGQAYRLFAAANPGDTFGLWLQLLACGVAFLAGGLEAVRSFRARRAPDADVPRK